MKEIYSTKGKHLWQIYLLTYKKAVVFFTIWKTLQSINKNFIQNALLA